MAVNQSPIMIGGSFCPVPGVSAKHAIITDICRENRSDAGAFEEAIARLRSEYEALCQGWPVNNGAKFHVVLTLERPPALPKR